MSACAATLGSVSRLRKHSSVPNRPPPSAGVSRAARAAAPPWTFAQPHPALPCGVLRGAGLYVGESRHQVRVGGGAGTRPTCCLFGLALRSGDGLACGGVI